jgi:hypothetical protein
MRQLLPSESRRRDVVVVRKTLDCRHDAFVAEVEQYANSCGLSFEGNPAYHDRLPQDAAENLKYDYSAAGLAERLRCDKRMMNPVSGTHMPVEAKTSYRYTGPAIYLFEAYQIGLHKAMRDGCLYAIRKVCGPESRDCGFFVGGSFGAAEIREIRIPNLIWRNGSCLSRSAGECQDSADFYRQAFADWFPEVSVVMTNTNEACKGSGDPFAVMDDTFMRSLPDWRSLVYEFAYGHQEANHGR